MSARNRELLLDLEGDGIGVDFVRGGGIAEDVASVAARDSENDGQFDQHTAQYALFDAARGSLGPDTNGLQSGSSHFPAQCIC